MNLSASFRVSFIHGVNKVPAHHVRLRRAYNTMAKNETVREGILLGLGNPLLDMTVVKHGSKLLEKFGLEANNAVLASPQQLGIFKEIAEEYNPTYIAGGATQNSIRVAQWLIGSHWATTFLGGAGDDIFQQILADAAKSVGVHVHYQVWKGDHTGVCAAIITGENRSLITELGAASRFCASYLRQPDVWPLVEAAQLYYVGGFLLSVSPEAALEVAKHSSAEGKVLASNLHAPFLCKYFADPDIGFMPFVDIIFGNEKEARQLAVEAEMKNSGKILDDVKEIAQRTVQLPKANSYIPRTVVFTQGGKEPVVIANQEGVRELPVCPVDPADIKDTNGCGDAFVGGFLSQLVKGKSLDDCLKCGLYASKTVIQHYGCTFPDHPEFSND